MFTRRTFCLAALSAPSLVLADAPRRGLAWNRTGLPLVFPLHVTTSPGHAYFVKLASVPGGEDAIAAHFNGGDLFRVLCPPGQYRVSFARGQTWQDERQLFGPKTEIVEIPEPLEFHTEGFRTRKGWIVDLRDFNRPSILL